MFEHHKTLQVVAVISGYSLHVGVTEIELKRISLESEVPWQKTQVLPSKEVVDKLWSFVKCYRSFGRSSYLVNYNILYSVYSYFHSQVGCFSPPPVCFFLQIFPMKSGWFGLPPTTDWQYLYNPNQELGVTYPSLHMFGINNIYTDYIWYISYRWRRNFDTQYHIIFFRLP